MIEPHRASGSFCFGRDGLCSDLIASAFEARAALLFGGRQAGKTTVLRRIATQLGQSGASVAVLDRLDLGVYVDLMALPHDATPIDFYRLLSRLAWQECKKRILGYSLASPPSLSGKVSTLDAFTESLRMIISAGGNLELRILFLLDEAKRALGNRFPRGFQDNLFALLYGEEAGLDNKIAIVFAGAQELYKFCEDDTSPIGSRAARHFLEVLDSPALARLVDSLCSQVDSPSDVVEFLLDQSGGHAGLTVRMLEHAVARDMNLVGALEDCRRRQIGLLRLWQLALSKEARCVQAILPRRRSLRLHEAARALHESGFSQFAADRAFEELRFTGIAAQSEDGLICVNRIYWDYVGSFSWDEAVSQRSGDTWQMIETVELKMREFVRLRYEGKWPGKAYERMKKVLGDEKWSKLESIRARSSRHYPLSPRRLYRDLMDCMYLGDLVALIISRSAWPAFRDDFRDKREVQDLLASITPVRNDRAHFAQVPEKEQDRCRIACDDLLVLIEQALAE